MSFTEPLIHKHISQQKLLLPGEYPCLISEFTKKLNWYLSWNLHCRELYRPCRSCLMPLDPSLDAVPQNTLSSNKI